MHVDLFVETDSRAARRLERKAGYVLACQIGGQDRTVQGFMSGNWTYNEALLQAMAAGLKRMTASSEITVHCPSGQLVTQTTKIEEWAGPNQNLFKGKDGNPWKNQQLWLEIYTRMQNHKITFQHDVKTEYTSWLQAELKRN